MPPGRGLGVGDREEGRSEEREDVGPAAHKGPGGRLLPDGPEDLHLGDHPDHGGVDREEQEVGIVAAHVAGIHLGLEKARSPFDQGLEGRGHLGGGRRTEPGHLPYQAEELRPVGGQPEHRPDHRLDPLPAVPGFGEGSFEGSGELGGAPVDRCLEEGLFGREPVQDGLLGDLQGPGQVVEGGPLVAGPGEGGDGGVEDPLRGSPAHPPILRPVYHLVDRRNPLTIW